MLANKHNISIKFYYAIMIKLEPITKTLPNTNVF